MTRVSIHAPTKGATLLILIFSRFILFQSTLPRRERPGDALETERTERVSIHAPTKGATPSFRYCSMISSGFNPRSHEGSDPAATNKMSKQSGFNPRSHEGSDAISAKNSFQFSAVINKLLFSITNFPLFHPFFFTFLLHLCIFYSANLPTFSCPPPIRTLILSQNQCVIHCNSSIDTHMLHFGLILIPQIIESQTVNTFIDNICQNCLQSNTLGIIQNTFKYRILNSSPIICALFCNFPQPLSSRSSLSIHIICDQYKHSPTSLPQEYRISVQITS